MIRRAEKRGFTVVEMLISMTIMGLVLALAVVEFAMVFNHNNLTSANITAESNARISMAKVTNELRQAMPDITDFSANYPIVVNPPTPAPSSAPVASQMVQFYRVANVAGGLQTPLPLDTNGNPVPCYDLETLTYDPVAKTITKDVKLITNSNCSTASDVSNVIAYNIIGFSVQALSTQLLDVDLQTQSQNGGYGIYDLNTQVALGYKP
jgi:prepilin-type N-terminal cleavage/methylation domain-containing protein